MSNAGKNLATRRWVTYRIFEIGLLAVLIVGGVYGYRLTRAAQVEVAQKAMALEELPRSMLHLSLLREELENREQEFRQILGLVPRPDGISDFIGDVEEAASRHGVSIQIPQVSLVPVFDEGGGEIEPTGPHREVRLVISAVGEPAALLELLHELEHFPYLVYVPEWELGVAGRGGSAPVGTSGVLMAGDSRSAPSRSKTASLQASLLLTVQNEKP